MHKPQFNDMSETDASIKCVTWPA